MANLGRLKIEEEHHVTGRGMVLTLDLVENKLAVEPIIEIPVKAGDTLIYHKQKFEVSAIEATRKNGSIDKMVGLVVKEAK